MNEQPQIIGLFYFSGTGNTKTVAELLAFAFKEQKRTVDVLAIDELLKSNKAAQTKPYDLVGFGYPVHAFNAPRIFFDFINTLPDGQHKKTFMFKTSGDPFMNGGSTALVRKALHKKGYDVSYERLFVMPANVLIRFKDPLIKQLYMTAVRKAHATVTDILSGTTMLQNNSLFSTLFTAAFSGMESSGARFFGTNLRVSDSCTLCGICMNNCPTNNIIKQKDHIRFQSKCTLCMRCIYGCPINAISPRYFKFLVVKKWYDLQKIINNPTISDTYITRKTKGYFRHYYSYFSKT